MDQIKTTFTFGRNWRRFLKSYTLQRQQIAKESLLNFLKVQDLKGQTFLDIGSGSGIHSAAAFLAGAKRIHSFDYDPDSVAATRFLHEKCGSPAHWTIEQASVLDDAYMKKLGTFDVVYSWGVLHHTGDQWKAIQNAALCMADTSKLFIALYAKEAYPDWPYWQNVKKRYNQIGALGKLYMEARYMWIYNLEQTWSNVLAFVKTVMNYKNGRGMALWSDVRDWLGGWPTEFSSVEEIHAFASDKLGLSIVNLNFGEANTEFLLMKQAHAASLGLRLYSGRDLPYHLPELSEATLNTISAPVWIFGAAKGGQMVFDFLSSNKVPVAGFIEPTPEKKELRGVPVVAYDAFVQQEDRTVPVILASKYLVPNWTLLKRDGFENGVNGFSWIIKRFENDVPSLL